MIETVGLSTLVGLLSDTDAAVNTVAEGAAAGSATGITIAATDGSTDTVTYGLVDDAGGRFQIDANTGVVTVKAPELLAPNAALNYTIKAIALSADGSFTHKSIVIDVTGINDAPTAINLSTEAVTENTSDLVPIATLTASDPDQQVSGLAGPFTYQVVASPDYPDGTKFFVVVDKLMMIGSADYETQTSYDILLRVTDAGGASFDVAKTITVTNISPETIYGTSGNDVRSGGSDIDKLFGLAGNDALFGFANNDILTGGVGRDVMTGGTGYDDFDFDVYTHTGKTSATRDVIKDFQHLIDDIDLRTIDANGSAAGVTAFKFLALKGAAFTGVRGQLHWYQINVANNAADKTIIEGDINGDGCADFQIELTGLKTLTASDFIF